MFPRSIYQSLPFLYISLGLLCILIVDSPLIFFSSALLIAAGWLVMWMRRRNLVDPEEYIKASQVPSENTSDSIINEKSSSPDYERRSADERSFPLTDNNGGMIAFNRRMC